MNTHTPGPWHAVVDETATVRDKDGQLAIFTHMKTIGIGGRRRSAEVAANTRLAAAAPDLLKLLVESQSFIGGDWRERRDAAILKATGSAA